MNNYCVVLGLFSSIINGSKTTRSTCGIWELDQETSWRPAPRDKSAVARNVAWMGRFIKTQSLSSRTKITSEVLTPTFLSSSPTMLRAEILADVVRGVPERLSPATTHPINSDTHVLMKTSANPSHIWKDETGITRMFSRFQSCLNWY